MNLVTYLDPCRNDRIWCCRTFIHQFWDTQTLGELAATGSIPGNGYWCLRGQAAY